MVPPNIDPPKHQVRHRGPTHPRRLLLQRRRSSPRGQATRARGAGRSWSPPHAAIPQRSSQYAFSQTFFFEH
eukprot:10042550-Alexandrium_andersonii.AAC.1